MHQIHVVIHDHMLYIKSYYFLLLIMYFIMKTRIVKRLISLNIDHIVHEWGYEPDL